ncbi:MAG: hypothetical protein OXL97_09940 [Chloroflexota bacterium]|nr:hypothetical protein [Chloroflexota bacterium]MDE2885253.1 hypothetical protein [Chloroflexota bacterium]
MTAFQRQIPEEEDLKRMLERAGMVLSEEDLQTMATAFPSVRAQLERLYSYNFDGESYPFRTIFPETNA